jgi:inosine/xanthosine triphosphatase
MTVRILVASTNPVKIEATREAFASYYPEVSVDGIEVASQVPAQPVGAQTYEGARNRARTARQAAAPGSVAFCVGIEGGIVRVDDRWFALGWICIIDADGREAYGASPWFELPAAVIGEVLSGVELGAVMDRLTGSHDTKRRGGAIGHFTRGVVSRTDLYAAGLRVALVPVLNARIFTPAEDS